MVDFGQNPVAVVTFGQDPVAVVDFGQDPVAVVTLTDLVALSVSKIMGGLVMPAVLAIAAAAFLPSLRGMVSTHPPVSTAG